MKFNNNVIRAAFLVMCCLPIMAAVPPALTLVDQTSVEAAIKSSGIEYMTMSTKGNFGFDIQLQGDINFVIEINEGKGIWLTAKLYHEKGAPLKEVNRFNMMISRTGKFLSCAYLDNADVPTNQHFLMTGSEVSSTLLASTIGQFVRETNNLSGFLFTSKAMLEIPNRRPTLKHK